MKLIRILSFAALSISLLTASCYIYLNRDIAGSITPATFTCVEQSEGDFLHITLSHENIYGIGLAYADHIKETASDFDANIPPPVFKKSTASLAFDRSNVRRPHHAELVEALSQLEPDIMTTLNKQDIRLLPLLDYEAELAFTLLNNISDEQLKQPDFSPEIGFFVANDLSARSLAILGEGQTNKHDYWGVSKSFLGFTPVSSQIWRPHHPRQNTIPCVNLQTVVDGEPRQNQNTKNLIYTPLQMLRFIKSKYPSTPLNKGDIILTGTPRGVILNVPRWKARLAKLIGLNRFQKLSIQQRQDVADAFLKAGSEVLVSAEWLGQVSTTIVDE